MPGNVSPSVRQFEQRGFLVRRRLLSRDFCRAITHYATIQRQNRQLLPSERKVERALQMYGDPLTEALMLSLQPTIERVVGLRLHPTFSYARLHSRGARLPVHTDRDASEVTASVTIEGDFEWPLWIRANGRDRAVLLAPGDAVIFRGQELPHWRDSFRGSRHLQILFCYVSQDGTCAAWKWDKRRRIGWLPPEGDTQASRPGRKKREARRRKSGRARV